MNKMYTKPVILANDEISEGVYTASGSGDCWTISVSSAQEWNGSHHVFEVKLVHSTSVVHISSATTATITFNYPLTSASYAEYGSSVSGNSITVTRELLADAYNSGDTVTYKVWATTGDETTTKALAVTATSVSCTKTANVQGEID